jgi:MFS family permease
MLPAVASSAIAVMLPAIADAFHKSSDDLIVKMVSTALGLGMFLGAPLGGVLCDRLGRRLTLILASGTFGVLGCSLMLMNSLHLLIAARFLIGLTAGTIGVGLAAAIAENFDADRQRRWIGFSGGAGTFAILILIPLTGFLTDMQWQLGFVTYVIAFPVFLAIMFGLPKVRSTQSGRPAGGSFKVPLDKIPFSTLFMALILGTLMTGTSLYWPFRLRDLGVNSAGDIALYALGQILLIGIGTIAYGKYSRFLSVPTIFTIAGLLSALGLTVIAVSTHHVGVLIGLAIEGAGIGMMTPNLTVLALSVADPDYRGRILGLVKGVIYGSPFLTQFVLHPLNVMGGSSAAIGGIAGLSVGLALAVMIGWIGRPGNNMQQMAKA